jgi:hypothetical protein
MFLTALKRSVAKVCTSSNSDANKNQFQNSLKSIHEAFNNGTTTAIPFPLAFPSNSVSQATYISNEYKIN